MITDEIAEAFALRFKGRTDVWGSVDGLCNKEPVTLKHYRQHLEGEVSLGVYMLLDDGTLNFAAIDLDERDYDKALAIRKAFNKRHLHAYISHSKSKGFHVYTFAELGKPMVGKEIRAICHDILRELDLSKVEVFPKQDRLDEVIKVGSYINLPCFGNSHRQFMTADKVKVPIEEALKRIVGNPPDLITQIASTIKPSPPPRKNKETQGRTKQPTAPPPCIITLLRGVTEGIRDNAAFALARHYLGQLHTPEEVLALLEVWDKRNHPPLNDLRLLETKIKSAEKGYAFGCNSITDNPLLAKFCVGQDTCEWFQNPLKRVTQGQGCHITLDGRTYGEKDGKIVVISERKDVIVEKTLTSFTIEPQLRISLDGQGELLKATLKVGQRQYPDIFFKRESWNSKQKFLATLPSVDLQFFGSDLDVQAILALVSNGELPIRRGTTLLGRNENLWVLRDGVLSEGGWSKSPEIIYIPSDIDFDKRIQYPASLENGAHLVTDIIPKLLLLNAGDVMFPVLGWFFATPFAPLIRRRLRHFPILILWGTHGAGKSTLLRVLWDCFGVKSELFSSTETPFTFLRLFSGTNSIPILIDEFKPFNMGEDEVRLLIRYLKRLYDGEVEHRGRPDLSLVAYRLQAPVAIAGEVSPCSLETAMAERVIQANLNRDTLADDSPHIKAYKELSEIHLSGLAPIYVRWCLGMNFNDLINEAMSFLPELPSVPVRVRDNVLVMVSGLVALREFSRHYGYELKEQPFREGIKESANTMVAELLQPSQEVGLTLLLKTLATMAATGRIKRGVHYTTDGDVTLYIHLDDCLPEFRKFVRETTARIEILDKNAYQQQAREAYKRRGYVLEASTTHYFKVSEDNKGKVRRCVKINMEALPFDISGFEESR